MSLNRFALATALALASSAAVAHDMAAMGTMRPRPPRQHMRSASPANAAKVDRVIAITMHDMSFEPSSIVVKRGETIRFAVVNAGPVDHDFTIGDAKAEAEHRAEMPRNGGQGG